MRRRLCCLLLAVFACAGAARAEEPAVFPPETYDFAKRQSARYESETLVYSIESFSIDGSLCLLTKLWVRDPQRQIRKVNAPWGTALADPMALVKQIPEAVLSTNASGYIRTLRKAIPVRRKTISSPPSAPSWSPTAKCFGTWKASRSSAWP